MNETPIAVLIHTADNHCYIPAVLDDLSIEWARKGSPGKLTFRAVQDELLSFEEGAVVQVKRGDAGIFQGIVFSRRLDKDGLVFVTAYDQLRYLKNKMVYNAVGKKASEIIRELAEDFGLTCGEMEDTGYVIPRFRAGEQTLFDLMQTAIDMTTQNQQKLFVLYDDYGKLTVKNMEDMAVDILIDAETAENFQYASTIDRDTYNRIKLYFDNKDTEKREVWIAEDSANIGKWGLLQMTQSVNPSKAVNLSEKAQAMLKRYNRARQSLSIRGALGDDRVRGGSTLWLSLHIDGKDYQMRVLVERVKHTYKDNEHFMDLTLRGGVFE